jgi:hypothetical protein
MKIRPLHDRVIVKRLDEERTSPGGIVIPDTAAEKPVQGKIVAVGKGKISKTVRFGLSMCRSATSSCCECTAGQLALSKVQSSWSCAKKTSWP